KRTVAGCEFEGGRRDWLPNPLRHEELARSPGWSEQSGEPLGNGTATAGLGEAGAWTPGKRAVGGYSGTKDRVVWDKWGCGKGRITAQAVRQRGGGWTSCWTTSLGLRPRSGWPRT